MSERKRVWCIGFPRMGTTSLCQALKMLGWDVIHNPLELADFHRCNAAADILCTLHWKFLDALWPDSLFILNTRPFGDWERSLWDQGFFWNAGTNRPPAFARYDFNRTVDHWTRLFGSVYGKSGKLRESYNRHHADVRNWFSAKPGQLLELDIRSAGWESLCGFIGADIPAVAFPWANKKTIGEDVKLGITSRDL